MRGGRDLMTELLAGDHAEVDALLCDLSREFERGDVRAVFERLDYLWRVSPST
jgi:hypothetical protein